MEQLTFIPLPYRYIIDSCSIFSQKDGEPHRRKVHKKLWLRIEELIRNKEIVICRDIYEEIHDIELQQWINELECVIIELDRAIENNVINIVSSHPNLVNFKQNKSSGDAFLIATAMKHSLTVITEENKTSPNKIPMVCKNLSIPCIDINDLCEHEGWEL